MAGTYLINGELSVLQMIMKECGEWDRIKPFYKPMRVPKRRGGHSISGEEERLLREVAFSRPKWRLAAHCMTVMLSTTMGFGELRHVRRRDVDMKRRCILVRDGAKNFYRDRTIPMNAAAYESMSWMLERWEELGRIQRRRVHPAPSATKAQGPWIFTEPMKSVNTAFNGIRKEAGLPKFRVYDCRVQAITKLLSNPKVSRRSRRRSLVTSAKPCKTGTRSSSTTLKWPLSKLWSTPQCSRRPNQRRIQAEIKRQVDLALQCHMGRSRSPQRPMRRRPLPRRRLAIGNSRERIEKTSRPSAANVVSFPGLDELKSPPASRQAINVTIAAEMKFSEAASSWLDMRDAGASRARYLKPRMLKTYRLELDATSPAFIGDTPDKDIHIGHIRSYQVDRSVSHHRFPGAGEKSGTLSAFSYRMPEHPGLSCMLGVFLRKGITLFAMTDKPKIFLKSIREPITSKKNSRTPATARVIRREWWIRSQVEQRHPQRESWTRYTWSGKTAVYRRRASVGARPCRMVVVSAGTLKCPKCKRLFQLGEKFRRSRRPRKGSILAARGAI